MTSDQIIKKIALSEIFGNTFQGEAEKTGAPTTWIRFKGCNMQCDGYGQKDPTDPSTWILDYKDLDVSKYTRMEELPVFERGCDSSYSWSRKFAHLCRYLTPQEVTTEVRSFLTGGTFRHPKSRQWTHMAFTGGEPMLSQDAMVAIMSQFEAEDDVPAFVTIETNGTRAPKDHFANWFANYHTRYVDSIGMQSDNQGGFEQRLPKRTAKIELFWSVSPKLFLSGEAWTKAIRPEVVERMMQVSNCGQLKYVCDNSQRAWDEIEQATELFRARGVDWDVWAMPVGSSVAGQQQVAAQVAEGAVKRGYNFAARVHTYVFGNVIGK